MAPSAFLALDFCTSVDMLRNMASPALTIDGRYQLDRKPIGQGGMGMVFRAYDIITKRHVALKTMRGSLSPAGLELFSKEWTVLAQLSHPNIVDVLDTGEFEQDGSSRPFFVMPFLPGKTLEQLIKNANPRLTVDRVVGIVSQTCRGLQAAHERGLIHRDLKPSNIFVLDDDSVKIIDFGIVHLAGADSIMGLKGTLPYMAPEQIDLKGVSAASDIFSLAVVCYEALTGRKPFDRKTEFETADAIRRYTPPPICDLNPLVSQMVSRVIHKAMAKEPWHRFSTAREYADSLQKALNGESLDRFDRAKIQPRIARVKKAFGEGDHQFASEILTELEAEGNIDPEMSLLRIQIDHAVRQKSIRQLLDSARTRLEEDEFPLALQKIQEVLDIDPDNPDAVGLRSEIEKLRSHYQTDNWFRLVDQHIHNQSFGQAKQGLQEVLKLNPDDKRARDLLVEVEHKEQELGHLRGEKEKLYQSALYCYNRGEISSALTKLERVLDLTRQSPDSAIPERDAQYQSLYNQIRTERETAKNAYAEGRRHLADRNFAKALEICNEFLNRSPGDPMFQALKLEGEEQLRQDQSAFIADVSRRVDAEPDLDRRVNLLKEAADRFPEEPHLQQSLRLVRERRDLVNAIVGKARQYEERGQFNEALSQFDILRNIYSQYPGLEFETEQLKRRRDDQLRQEAKARWVEQIDRQIASGDYARAGELAGTALGEFPDDRELAGLERLAEVNLKRSNEAEDWLQRGQKLCFDRDFGEGLEAASLDNRNAVIRAALLNALVEQARSVLGQDWRAAEPLIEQALSINGGNPSARNLQSLVLDYKRQEIVNDCVSQAREMQAAGDLSGALAKVEEVLTGFPNEIRLVQLSKTLRNLGAVSQPAAGAPMPPPPGEESTPPSSRNSAPTETLARPQARPSGDYTFLEPDKTGVPAPPSAPPPQNVRHAAGGWGDFGAHFKNLTGITSGGLKRFWALLRSLAEPKGRWQLQWVVIGAASLILLLAFAVSLSHRSVKAPLPLRSEFLIDVECNVTTAKYLVDGTPAVSLPMRLLAGEHKLEASSPGYKSFVRAFSIPAGAPKSQLIPIRLEPELMRVRLSSDLKSGQIKLDEQPPVDLQDGGFGYDGIALSTEHRVSLLQSGKEALTFSFRAEPGGIVTLASPVSAKNVSAVVIASLASRARVYATDSSLKGALKDQTAQPIAAEGLELNNLADNTEFILDDGKSPRPLPIEVSNAPTLTVWLASDPNLGTLELQVNVPDAELMINGRKRRAPRPGKNYYTIEPGLLSIRLSKEGYEPQDQNVDLKKGKLALVPAFELKAVTRQASLVIEGASPGTQVLVDGAPAGVVGANGSYRRDDMTPASHAIVLRKPDYEDKELQRTFTAGQIIHLSGAEGQLTQLGIIDFRLSPQNTTVMYRRMDEPSFRPADNGKKISVKAGRYLVTANPGAKGNREEQIAVEPGKTTPVEWTIAAPEEPKGPASASRTAAPKQPTASRDYFQDPESWTQSGNWWVHKGGSPSWLRNNQGTYLIEFSKQTARFTRKAKRVEWIVDQNGSGNHIDYSFDFTSLERRATGDGKAGKEVKQAVDGASGDRYTLQIEIGPERIVIRDAQGKELDQYERPNRGQPLGRFGFKGDVALVVRRAE
jgi:serine/threonine protein kinase